MSELESFFFSSIRKEIHLFLLILLAIPLGLNGGIVSLASVYITGSTGAIPADVTMAVYAQSIGLVLGIPGIFTLEKVIPSRNALVMAYVALFISNIALCNTDQPLIIVMTSFFSGFFKIIGLREILNALIPILMPHGERYRLYSIYFPVTLIATQLSSVIVVRAADLYNWEFGQMLLNLSLIAGLILIIFVVHPGRVGRRGPLTEFDWFDLTLIAIGMLLLNYVLSYGLTYDWFESPKIVIASFGCLFVLSLILIRANLMRQPAVDFSVLSFGNVRFGLIVLFLITPFYIGNNLQNNMLEIILKGNAPEITRINFFVIWGFLIGALLSYLYYTYRKSFKTVMITVIICYSLSFVILFFESATIVESSTFYFPAILRGIAVVLSYTAVGIYISEGVPFSYFLSLLFFYLFTRMFLGPAFWSSVLSYIYYSRFIYHIDRLATRIDLTDVHHREVFGTSLDAAIRAGFSTDQATNQSTGIAFGRVANQAALLTYQEIFGGLVMFGLVFIISIIIIKPFKQINESDNNETVFP